MARGDHDQGGDRDWGRERDARRSTPPRDEPLRGDVQQPQEEL